MLDTVVIPVTISKEAYELITSGKAVFSSGGVRDAEGRLRGLYTLCADTNIFQDPTNFPVSQKMASSISKVVGMEKDIKKAIKVLEATNTGINAALAASVFNCAITAIGFAVISNQINNVAGKIDRLANQLKEYRIEDKSMEIKTMISDLVSIGDVLKNRKLNENDILTIEKSLNKTQTMMDWLIREFEKSETDTAGYLFELLYNLSMINASILKEYGAQYYYKFNQYPTNYNRWTNTLRYASQKKMCDVLKRTVWVLNPTAMPNQITNAVNVTLNSINLQRQDLLEYKKIVPKIPMEAHYDMAKYVETQLKNGNYVIDDNAEAAFVF